jgi:hypothetical protein
MDVASFEDATFLASRGGESAVADADRSDIYLRTPNTLDFPRIVQFPRSPAELAGRPIRFANFSSAGLRNVLDPTGYSIGEYRSLYIEELPSAGSSYSIGGVFTLPASNFGDPQFGAPISAEPVALVGELVFCQTYGTYPGVKVYSMDNYSPFCASLVETFEGVALNGTFDAATSQIIVLVRGGQQTGVPPSRLIALSPFGSGYTVRCNFPTSFLSVDDLTMADGINSQGFVLGTIGYSNGVTSSNLIWRVDRNGSFVILRSFPGASGLRPKYVALGNDGWIYGVSDRGGPDSRGLIFRLRPDGSDLQVRWGFRKNEYKGAYPYKLVRDDSTNGTAFFVMGRYEDSYGYNGSLANARNYTLGYYQEVDASQITKPGLSIYRDSPDGLAVWLNGENGAFYTLEVTTNLINWKVIGTFQAGPLSVPVVPIPNPGPNEFFRARTANPP